MHSNKCWKHYSESCTNVTDVELARKCWSIRLLLYIIQIKTNNIKYIVPARSDNVLILFNTAQRHQIQFMSSLICSLLCVRATEFISNSIFWCVTVVYVQLMLEIQTQWGILLYNARKNLIIPIPCNLVN